VPEISAEVVFPQLRASLLAQRPPPPPDGLTAFKEHKVLAAAVHRAALLDAFGSESETDAFVRYVTAFFPPPRNDPTDAGLLFGDWRTDLL
jgi:hypothetical protein